MLENRLGIYLLHIVSSDPGLYFLFVRVSARNPSFSLGLFYDNTLSSILVRWEPNLFRSHIILKSKGIQNLVVVRSHFVLVLVYDLA